MPMLILIPFSAFFCCVLGQFYFARRIRRILANRHSEIWRDLSTNSFFIDNAVFSFILKKRYLGLNDLELTSVAGQMRKLQLFAIGVWLIYMLMLFTIRSPMSAH